MNSLSHACLTEASLGRVVSTKVVSRFSASEVRQAIAELVQQDRIDLAHALGDAGYSLYPNDEEMLAICALLSEMRQDWPVAEEYLSKLILAQGGRTPVTTWQHYIRVLRCLCELPGALSIAEVALAQFPDNAELRHEYEFLKQTIGQSSRPDGTDTQH